MDPPTKKDPQLDDAPIQEGIELKVISNDHSEAIGTNDPAAISEKVNQPAQITMQVIENARSQPKTKLSTLEFILVFIGLCLAILLASLDQTIVATALPAIGSEFGHFDQIAWVGSAYFITASSFSCLYGKLVDIFGRKHMFFGAILIFEIGSAISGASTSLVMMIIARAIQGIGGGGIFSLVMIIISDIVVYEDRGKYQGIVGACFGLSSVIGPLIGGAFTDNISWRWCFYINLPLGCFTLIVCGLFMPHTGNVDLNESIQEKLKRVDFLGVFFLISSVVCFTTPIQAGGTTWLWSDWQTIFMLVMSGVLGICFVLVECFQAKEPLIPPALFVNWNVRIFPLIALFLGAAFFGPVFYTTVYFEIVVGDTATNAGIALIPLMMAVVVCSIISGQLLSRYGRYEPFLYFGSAFLIIGIGLLSTFDVNTSDANRVGFMIVTGIGIGNLVQMRLLGIQASVKTEFIAIATAVSTFSQTLGGVIGLSVIGTVFNNQFTSNLNANLPAELSTFVPLIVQNPSISSKIPALQPLKSIILNAAADAIQKSFYACLPFAIALFLLILCVRRYKNGERVK